MIFNHFYTDWVELMSLKIHTLLLLIMSLFSVIVFIIILLLTTVKSEMQKEQPSKNPSVLNFKEFLSNIIKEQSSKIQMLLKKIQTNSKNVLKKIETMKQYNKNNKNKDIAHNIKKDLRNEHQIESPISKKVATSTETSYAESRSFNTHYTMAPSGYGTSGNGHYGGATSTYHHHSIGFDPINIVVSMSLLSFLLQALGGLLTRTRMPMLSTPVVEARSRGTVQEWLKQNENGLKQLKIDKYSKSKSKYPKKYYVP